MTQDEASAALAALGLTEAEGYPLIGGECPVEAEAWLGNARLYFRSRGSQWKLEICPRGFPERALHWVAPYGRGEFDAGYMPLEDAVKIIAAAVEIWRLGQEK